MIETYRGVVYPDQLDHMGHMNVRWYTSKFDEATWHFFSSVGITNTHIKKSNCGMAAVEQVTQYKAEVMAGALLVIRTEILEVGNKTLKFRHHMFDVENEKPVATTVLTAVYMDRGKRKADMLPEFVRVNCDKLLG